jgi:YD repeat-containing protein
MKKLAEFLLIITGMGVLGLENTARASNNTGQPCGNHAVNSPAAHNTDNQDQEGDPFNPYTGNEYRSIPDLKVWGGVGEHQLSFTRFANSRFVGGAQYFGDGHSWRHNYQWDIADAASDGGSPQIEIIAPEGSDTIFTQSTTPSIWVPPTSTTETLTQSGSDFYLQRKNGFRYHIVKTVNGDGSDYYLMADFTDTQGNDYVLTYNAAHEVVQVTEPGGRFLQINYTTVNLNKVDFNTLATIATQPANATYTTVVVTDPTAYRYLRYIGPDGGHNDVGEVQFYDTNGNLITGTPFGTSPAYSSGHEFGKAFDGNTSTYVDDSHTSGGFCGIDLGAGHSAVVGSIRYYPRPNYTSRMMPAQTWLTPARFQGSNQAPVSVDAITGVNTSDGRSISYQYTPLSDPTVPYVYQTLTAVNYDDGTQASYVYQQTMPSTTPLITSYVDPRYELPFTQSNTVYYSGVEQAVGEISRQVNPVTGESVSTLTSADYTFPVVTKGNGAARQINIVDSTGSFAGLTDGAGVSTSVFYNPAGFRKSHVDGLGRTWANTPSAYAHPVALKAPDGSTKTIPRDSLDLPLGLTDELGHTTTITRDQLDHGGGNELGHVHVRW